MLRNLYQTPASTRPIYAFEALQGTGNGGNPLKKAVIVALMAVAAGLFLILPDGDDDVFAIEADSDGGSAAVSVPQRATATTLLGELSSRSVGEIDDAATAQVAVATEAALAGREHNLRTAMAISSAGDLMEQARAAVAELNATTTTAAPVVAAPSKAKVSPTQPAAADETTSSTGEESTTAGSTDTTLTGGETPSTEAATSTTADAAADGASAPAESSTTTPPTTAAPETTAPPTTAADPATAGWVDTGNGVLVPPVLLSIRHCESRGNYTAANPASSARGAYQFLTGSWKGYGHRDRYGVNQAHLASPAQQDEAALITWQRDGTRPWNASRSCWG